MQGKSNSRMQGKFNGRMHGNKTKLKRSPG